MLTPGGGNGITSNDLLAKVEYPDATTGAASSAAADSVSYTYNALGQPVTMTDQNGTVHGYGYDVLGRPVADSVQTLGTGVDGTVKLHTTSYDQQGNVYQMTAYGTADGSGAVLNQVRDVYNGLGQLTGEYQSHSGAVSTSSTPEVQYGYSDPTTGSRMTTLTYPNGRILHYGYDGNALDEAIGRVSYQADDNGSGSDGPHIVDYTYMGAGTVVKQADANGVALSYLAQPGDTHAVADAGDSVTGLDRFGRVIDQNWVNPTTGVSTDRFQYGYDANSNVLYKNNLISSVNSELYHASSTASGDTATAYDPLNRLTGFARGTLSASGHNGSTLDTVPSAARSQSWNLDALGNWVSSATNGTTTSRTNNSKNQVTTVGASSLTFDHNGNTLTDETGQHYTYDAWNHITKATNASGTVIASYTYDAAGHRITESAAGTTTDLYLSNQWQVLEERQSGTPTAQYVWGIGYVDSLVERDAHDASVSGTGLNQRLYAQQDANYNVTAVTDSAGTVVNRWVYDSYGLATQLNADWSAGGSDLGWVYLHQGGRLEAATGLYYFRNRDYSATLGRWVEQDPALYLDGMNRYQAYGGGPTNLRDSIGLDSHSFPVTYAGGSHNYLDAILTITNQSQQDGFLTSTLTLDLKRPFTAKAIDFWNKENRPRRGQLGTAPAISTDWEFIPKVIGPNLTGYFNNLYNPRLGGSDDQAVVYIQDIRQIGGSTVDVTQDRPLISGRWIAPENEGEEQKPAAIVNHIRSSTFTLYLTRCDQAGVWKVYFYYLNRANVEGNQILGEYDVNWSYRNGSFKYKATQNQRPPDPETLGFNFEAWRRGWPDDDSKRYGDYPEMENTTEDLEGITGRGG